MNSMSSYHSVKLRSVSEAGDSFVKCLSYEACSELKSFKIRQKVYTSPNLGKQMLLTMLPISMRWSSATLRYSLRIGSATYNLEELEKLKVESNYFLQHF